MESEFEKQIGNSHFRHPVLHGSIDCLCGFGGRAGGSDKRPRLLFECLCVRDLRVYAQSLDGEVYHFRDRTGLECDAVVHLRNGKYGLIEIKLGGERLIEEGAKNLLTLKERIDTTKMKSPSFMMVLTAVEEYAYMRTDGVMVVPIGSLKN